MENYGVVFKAPKEVEIEKQSISKPEGNNVLVETSCSLISTGTELTILSGDFPEDSDWAKYANYPFYPGYNNIGEIVEVGEEVDKNHLGDRVAIYGNHSKYNITSIDSCRFVPDGVTDEQAVFFTIAEIVMNGIRRGEVTWGESVGVFGLGLLGQLAAQFSYIAGARPVFGLDIAENRLNYLPDKPGFIGVNSGEKDWVETIKDNNKGRLADVVFELTGNSQIITEELKMLRKQGRFVVLSSPKGEDTNFNFHDFCNGPSYRIIGSHNNSHPQVATLEYPWTQKRHCELYFDYVIDGSLEVDHMVSHKEDYQKAPELYDQLLEDRSTAMGIILNW